MQAQIARIDRARTSLIPFTEFTDSNYHAASHHILAGQRLDALLRGEIDRLLILMPPRHGKSELASVSFPAHAIGQNPKLQIIACSYGSELSKMFGRRVRDRVRHPRFQSLYPGVELSQDSQAADMWRTTEGGVYNATGVGGAITGFGADILLIDDPVKNREEADSETYRQKVWDWYTSTAYTRLMPGGRVAVILTHWHEDDLAGRLLAEAEEGGDQWEVLRLPAINDAGRALWPEWYDLDALNKIKRTVGSRNWSALYQQSPRPDDGLFFKQEWLHIHDALPDRLTYYGASDYAVTEDGGDYTAHGVFGLDEDKHLWLVAAWHGQETSLVWITEFLNLVADWKPMIWAEETGQIRAALDPFIQEQMRSRNVFVRRDGFPSRSDKAVRARSIQARMESDGLHIARNTRFFTKGFYGFRDELLAFPAGKHDDWVDMLSLMGQLLDKIFPPKPLEAKAMRPSGDIRVGSRNTAVWDRLVEPHFEKIKQGR